MKVSNALLSVCFSLFIIGTSVARGQLCPRSEQIINGSLNAATGPFQTDRIYRDALPSQCASPKVFPGTIASGQQNFTIHTFAAAQENSCVKVNFDTGTCGTGIFAAGYMNSYNPHNFSRNYLGDIGSSLPQSFSFPIQAGDELLLVTSSTDGPINCDYSFSIENYPCTVNNAITLTPKTATNNILTDHTVTATVIMDGKPITGTPVSFTIVSGPNAGEGSEPGSGACSPNDNCTTDVNGQVSWTYAGGDRPGQDMIVASFVNGSGQVMASNPVEKIWVFPPRPIPVLSEWELIAMAGGLGIVGLVVIQRRKAAV